MTPLYANTTLLIVAPILDKIVQIKRRVCSDTVLVLVETYFYCKRTKAIDNVTMKMVELI